MMRRPSIQHVSVCDECGGAGAVIGIGVDDLPWSAPCPVCRSVGMDMVEREKRIRYLEMFFEAVHDYSDACVAHNLTKETAVALGEPWTRLHARILAAIWPAKGCDEIEDSR